MKPRRLAALSALALLAGTVPAYAASDSLNATVKVNINVAQSDPICIQLFDNATPPAPISTLDFSTLVLLSATSTTPGGATKSRRINVKNCGTAVLNQGQILVRTTDMTGGGVTWNPSSTSNHCTATNLYRLIAGHQQSVTAITTDRVLPMAAAAGDLQFVDLDFSAPCTGSTVPPLGTDMGFTITFTATA